MAGRLITVTPLPSPLRAGIDTDLESSEAAAVMPTAAAAWAESEEEVEEYTGTDCDAWLDARMD